VGRRGLWPAAIQGAAGDEPPTPTFFATPDDFRAWFEDNHEGAGELWVGFYKVGSGRPSITWPQAVDQALCFGWIDNHSVRGP